MAAYKGIIGADGIGVNLRWAQGMPECSERIILLECWEKMRQPGHGSGAIN